MKSINLALVGASGLVGRTMLKALEEYAIPVSKLLLYGSARSAGTEIIFRNQTYIIQELSKDLPNDLDYALFSAGGSVSREYAPLFAAKGCVVIDNSSAWRMDENCPLIVPEVNFHHFNSDKPNNNSNKIIANPNCSTIQMMLPLKALHEKYGLRRVVVSTYQSISGAGQKGVDKLMNEINGQVDNSLSKHKIAFNTIFHSFTKDDELDGYTEEEIKMIRESRKILDLPNLDITATCVRLPILGGHGESLNIELNNDYKLNELIDTLAAFDGIKIINENIDETYPTVQMCANRDEVFVGRIRRDNSKSNSVNMWIVADNLHKGAASNAVQILKKLIENKGK